MTTTRTLRRIAKTTAMLFAFSLSGVFGVAAETDIYKDVLMPNGHARNMAAKLADIRACGGSKGVTVQEFPAVNDCMRAHGWVIDHVVPDSKPQARKPAASEQTYIDPDTGMSCHDVGGAAICVPPQGTVRYYDSRHHLNCQRTGAVAVCSNL